MKDMDSDSTCQMELSRAGFTLFELLLSLTIPGMP